MADYNDFIKGLAKARVEADNKRLKEDWEDFCKKVLEPGHPADDVKDPIKMIYEIAWKHGMLYGAQNPVV